MFIGCGSFVGGVLRYLLAKAVTRLSAMEVVPAPWMGIPWGTFLANVLGCFVLGLCYALFARFVTLSEELKLFLTVGFCGGFTTFSTFMNENFRLLQDGRLGLFVLYAAISLIAGYLMLYLGYVAGRAC